MSLVHFSKETADETSARLLGVLRRATITQPGRYRLVRVSQNDAAALLTQALAVVRDGETFSALVPAASPEPQDFAVFSFHFEADEDNSGFVGWLASQIKEHVGTGVIVICGLSADGAVFDYWGVPMELAEPTLRFIDALRRNG